MPGSITNDEQSLIGFRKALLEWYDANGRDLPWRNHEGEAYRVIVSELMLVQTTVAAVIPYYHRFLERFPTVTDLAHADEADVLKLWEGLGYYRRARHLHALAKAVVANHGGQFPHDEADLLALPGVGRYIAGAVRSFAFDLPAPILEANTIRLLARLIGLMETVELGTSQKTLWAEAARRVDPDRPGPFNQAMMDLGATICTPRQPACLICPVNKFCKAHLGGLTETIPLKAAKSPLKPGEEVSVIVKRPTDGSILLLKRSDQGLWADFWELPTFWQAGADPAKRRDQGFEYKDLDDLIQLIEALMGLRIKPLEEVQAKPIRYGVTTHKMTLNVLGTELISENLIQPQGFLQAEFVAPSEITKRTMSTAQRKALKIPLKG